MSECPRVARQGGRGWPAYHMMILAKPHCFSSTRTITHAADSRGYVQLLQILLKNGANPNIRNNHGKTPLQIAAKENDSESVRLLLKYGADPNIADKKGYKALCEADMKKFAGKIRRNKKHD